MKLFTFCLFSEKRFQKYNTVYLESNETIISHFKTLGCKAEGRRRRTVYSNGENYDLVLFGLVSEGFQEV